jgi:diketogulonate reductase-like aldo/keto reductase
VEDAREFHADGRARSIGVSNFQVAHLERLAAETDVVPAVNQVELHPYFQNSEVDAYNREHGIGTEAWAPIAQGKVLDDPALQEIAERLGKSRAQVVLRWHIERGNIVFPKSVTRRGSRRTSACSTSSWSPATPRRSTHSIGEKRDATARTPTCSITSLAES